MALFQRTPVHREFLGLGSHEHLPRAMAGSFDEPEPGSRLYRARAA